MAVVVYGGRSSVESDDGPTPRSREVLEKALERVVEDVRLAEMLARQIAFRDTLAPHVETALREALLLRSFRIRAFFYAEPASDDEVWAGDFFTESREWEERRPSAPAHVRGWIDDLSLCLEPRVSVREEAPVPREAWPLESAVHTLSETYEAFRRALPPPWDIPSIEEIGP